MPTSLIDAGDVLRARDIRRRLVRFGYTLDDQSFQSNEYSDISNLAVPVEPNGAYAITGYLAYQTGATPDIKFTMSAPVGTVGHWTAYPQTQTATGSIGDLEALRLDKFDDSEQQGAAGSAAFSSALCCMPRAYVRTGQNGGLVQMRFAQITTDASQTTVVTGSWIRAIEIEVFVLSQ